MLGENSTYLGKDAAAVSTRGGKKERAEGEEKLEVAR